MPAGLRVDCEVAVPLASGLGSSAAAIVTGLLGANELLGRPADAATILALATEVEGHPDNVAAALDGGLVVVVQRRGWPAHRADRGAARSRWRSRCRRSSTRRAPRAPSCRPTCLWPTRSTTWAARRSWSRPCAGATSSCSARRWTTACIRRSASSACPAGRAAMAAAREAGAAAVAVSGSGPSLIAFPAPGAAVDDVAAAMVDALARAGVRSRPFTLATTDCGAAAHPWPPWPPRRRRRAAAAAPGACRRVRARRRGQPRLRAHRSHRRRRAARLGCRPSRRSSSRPRSPSCRWSATRPPCEPRETYSVIAEAPAGSPDALLVAWLNELLYRIETDGIVFSSFSVEGLTHRYVSARVQGEPLDRQRHEPRLDVKAATYHGLSVRRLEDRWEATVVLDV